jgi:hypothetical protein
LASVLEQIEYHESRKGSFDLGTGDIAARDLPSYAIDKDKIDRRFTSDGKYFDMDLSIKLPNGRTINLGSGSVNLDAHGMPEGIPTLSLAASHHEHGIDYAVKIYDHVEYAEGIAPQGKGERTPLTKYAIDAFAKEYQARFGRPLNEIGGSLAWENKANFQKMLIEIMGGKNATVRVPRREPTQAELIEAVKRTSYGENRGKAGYTEFEVTIPAAKDWKTEPKLGEEYKGIEVPIQDINVIARKK